MNIFKVSIIILLVLLAAGCKVTTRQVDTTVHYNGGGELEYSFLKKVGGEEIPISHVITAITDDFKKNSLFKLKHTTRTERGTVLTKGFTITPHNDDTKWSIEVKNHDIWPSYENDTQTAIYKVEVEEVGDLYKVLVRCPNEFADKALNRADFNASENPDRAIRNFKYLCKQRSLNLTRKKYIRGELDSKYSSEDVFSNFSRILEKSLYIPSEVKAYDLNKAQMFKIKTKNLDGAVAIAVFPYRGGSKTNYAYKYVYNIGSDGTTSYDRNDIDELTKLMTNIVNN